MQAIRNMDVSSVHRKNLSMQPKIRRILSKQNKILKILIGRERKIAQNNKIQPNNALKNIATPAPGKWNVLRIAPNKNSAVSAHKRRLIFDINNEI